MHMMHVYQPQQEGRARTVRAAPHAADSCLVFVAMLFRMTG